MSTARDRKIEELKTRALMEALGSALKLADPQNPDIDIPSDVRAEVSSYLHSWVIGPMAMVLLGHVGVWEYSTTDSGVARDYLAKIEEHPSEGLSD